MWQGREILGLRLNFNKRYITLAPIATVIGLAFRMFDPEKLLGEVSDLGHHLRADPAHTPGVTIGRRHFPLNVPFQNGPLSGKDVFVPLDFIIGGPKMAGQGWRMLVEQLSVGRCISLPSNTTGGSKAGVFASGAYTRIRRQFNMPVGKFEGVEAVLARMVGYTYTMDAARSVTGRRHRRRREARRCLGHAQVPRHRNGPAGAQRRHGRARRQGHPARPAQLSRAQLPGDPGRHHRGRRKHPHALAHHLWPGRDRCHPFVLKEMNAARAKNVDDFDGALFGHVASPSAMLCVPSSWRSRMRASRTCRKWARRAATTSTSCDSRPRLRSRWTSPC
jgi:acyl-CoA dehydrogenase